VLSALVWAAACQFAAAQTPVRVVRVEEDWELVVKEPDPNSVAPQVTCVISPFPHIGSWYAVFELNHQTRPQFAAGGMQLQVWMGDSPVDWREYNRSQVMSQTGETVSWTQSMWLSQNWLNFRVLNGSSTTWGSFGGSSHVTQSVNSDLSDLNGYDPAISVAHSGVGFASNRVQSLVLKKVRIYLADGQTLIDSAPRVVFPKS
jgi:hypothetical protein